MPRDRGPLANEQAGLCYGDTNKRVECTIFPTRQILVGSPWCYTYCPFSGDVCAEGVDGITLMTTGLVDSKLLGINTNHENRFAFERNMTCAPVMNDYRFQEYADDAWVFRYEVGNERYYHIPRTPGPAGFDYRNKPADLSKPYLVDMSDTFHNRYEAW